MPTVSSDSFRPRRGEAAHESPPIAARSSFFQARLASVLAIAPLGGWTVIVLLPLAIHTLWGVGRLVTSRPNNLRYRFYSNLKYLLQRIAAAGVLFFLGAHLWLAMIRPRVVDGHPEPFADIAQTMHSHTPTLVVYVLGTLGVAYHLANGVQTFCMGWGVVSSQQALRRLEWVAILLFVLLLVMSWAAIYALWAAGAPREAAV
jgi:succinate dehydrogenase / fumarate reductase cytochrome b subunit